LTHHYALFFFKAPSGIISSFESIFNEKNWGEVRIIEKSPGLVGILFVLERRREVWG